MTTAYVLGVDAGNSKTAALVATQDGQVLGYGRADTGDIYGAVTEADAVLEVSKAIDAAVTMAGVEESDLVRAAFCLAGVDWTEDDAYWRDQLATKLSWISDYSLRNDGFATLRAGAPDGVGVGLTAGTGAAIVGRGTGGDEWSASFWITHPVGGADLGSEAVKAVVRAQLGIGRPTALREALLARYGFATPDDMLEAFTRRSRPADLRYADAARTVLDVARSGDVVAGEIVDAQASAFGAYARTTAERVGYHQLDPVPVVLGGSVFTGDPLLADRVTAAVESSLPAAVVTASACPPLVGAALEALAESPGGLSREAAEQLRAFPLPHDLLLT